MDRKNNTKSTTYNIGIWRNKESNDSLIYLCVDGSTGIKSREGVRQASFQLLANAGTPFIIGKFTHDSKDYIVLGSDADQQLSLIGQDHTTEFECGHVSDNTYNSPFVLISGDSNFLRERCRQITPRIWFYEKEGYFLVESCKRYEEPFTLIVTDYASAEDGAYLGSAIEFSEDVWLNGELSPLPEDAVDLGSVTVYSPYIEHVMCFFEYAGVHHTILSNRVNDELTIVPNTYKQEDGSEGILSIAFGASEPHGYSDNRLRPKLTDTEVYTRSDKDVEMEITGYPDYVLAVDVDNDHILYLVEQESAKTDNTNPLPTKNKVLH